MTCKFKHLSPKESVLLNVNRMYCYHCNAEGGYLGLGIYEGHGKFDGIIYDVFSIVYQCPSCLRNIKQYLESCTGEIFIMEIPIDINQFEKVEIK